ncbi:MAG TPA: SDR family oxidoreductase [Dehalococcoidia bacterium]|nr:SDR family oxidoreductase [Dehalococcoidia bacterium]
MTNLFDLSGKVAVVTGGSGAIGGAIALALADYGADIAVTSRALDKLQPVAAKISSMGRKALAVSADVTDEKSIINMVEQVVDKFSRIDILVNAAGMAIRPAAEDIAVKDWFRILEFNALGTFICCQAVGKIMIKQKSGKIVNISSIRGRMGTSMGGVAYGPSKGAVDALTRTLACEWAKYNIYVNAVAPSLILTELTRPLLTPERIKLTAAKIPLGRIGELEDVVGPVILLVSKASNYMTGQIIYIDGGSTAGIM